MRVVFRSMNWVAMNWVAMAKGVGKILITGKATE